MDDRDVTCTSAAIPQPVTLLPTPTPPKRAITPHIDEAVRQILDPDVWKWSLGVLWFSLSPFMFVPVFEDKYNGGTDATVLGLLVCTFNIISVGIWKTHR